MYCLLKGISGLSSSAVHGPLGAVFGLSSLVVRNLPKAMFRSNSLTIHGLLILIAPNRSHGPLSTVPLIFTAPGNYIYGNYSLNNIKTPSPTLSAPTPSNCKITTSSQSQPLHNQSKYVDHQYPHHPQPATRPANLVHPSLSQLAIAQHPTYVRRP